MPVLALQQQSDWENNVYVLTTTRILVIVGMAYLFRSLYQWARPLIERLHLAGLVSWAAGSMSSSSSFLLLLTTSSFTCLPLPFLHETCVFSANAAVDRSLAATSPIVDVSLDDLVPGSTITFTVDTDLSDTPNVRPPQPIYDPSHLPQSPPARPHLSPQSHQCSMLSGIPTSISTRMVASNDESVSGGSASAAIGIGG